MTNVTRLPGPIADVWDWQRLGLCRGRDSAQFFHPDGERGASRGRRESAAKAVCRACPVRAQCAAQALSTREPYGVWGGFTEAERLRLLAIGWEDCAERRPGRVDVVRLERRLGLRPASQPVPPVPAPTTAPERPAPVSPAPAGAATGLGVRRPGGPDQIVPAQTRRPVTVPHQMPVNRQNPPPRQTQPQRQMPVNRPVPGRQPRSERRVSA